MCSCLYATRSGVTNNAQSRTSPAGLRATLRLTPHTQAHIVASASRRSAMLSRRLLGVVLVGGISLLVGTGIAAAQAGGAAPPDAQAGVARTVTLTPQEQVAQAEGIVSRMESSRNSVRRQLETSRTQRDVVKVLCLNDKLNQIDVAIRSAKERKQALE